ncbi:MAG: L-glutamate gamma-semialdehyde dehydrogenase [Burkholderiaceae bacterium]
MPNASISYLAENERVLSYGPGTPERASLKEEIARQQDRVLDIPLVIGAQRLFRDEPRDLVCPHDHQHRLARLSQASEADAHAAVAAALKAREAWANTSFDERAAIFLKAADLLAGPWRQRLNAATMLGQSKTVQQAEIDSACELIDFLRFNVEFAARLYAEQPRSSPGVRNLLDYRPLEGFVYAITPFNFTAIGGNLPTAPALMGNTVVWKPATAAALSNYLFLELLEEAGLPSGVISFLPGPAAALAEALLSSPELAGIHFTGSTAVFESLWQQTAQNLRRYRSYPRLVGETGGKDFVLAHASADLTALATALLRGAFEYQGQKCSAASRAYVPASLWPELKQSLADQMAGITIGDVSDFTNFMGAVIDRQAYQRITTYIEETRASSSASIVAGGDHADDVGYFVRPTLIEVQDPMHKTMSEEIFGPVLSVYVYPDHEWSATLSLLDRTSPYALTGAVFAQDRAALNEAHAALRNAAGNFYVNDKPTGAVVGQQPFGGARRSGTNDKAGSMLNLIRWTSPRTVKETHCPPRSYPYPHMQV